MIFLPYEQVNQTQTWGKNLDRGLCFSCILSLILLNCDLMEIRSIKKKRCICVTRTTNDQMQDQALTHAVVLITLQGMVTVEAWRKIKTEEG